MDVAALPAAAAFQAAISLFSANVDLLVKWALAALKAAATYIQV